VHAGAIAGGDAAQSGKHSGGRLDVGIADRKIEDGIGSALVLETNALLKHAANPGRILNLMGDGL